ncbi:MAG TPA: arylesterase [Acidobacteriaceae bacterium]|nr:arylesterase [Acidobacteriaceae bacterium]
MKAIFSSVLMIAWLLGCNSSTSQPQRPTSTESTPAAKPVSAPQQPPVPSDSHRPTIVAFGDSLTAGLGVAHDESYPADLQRDLNARGYRYRVVNLGISGNTSKDGVLRIPEVLQFHPSIVIVAFGGNDGLRGLPIQDTEMNLFAIISAMQDAHAKVILGGITLPPNYGSDYIAKFNAIYVKASKEYHVPLLPFMLKGVYGVPGSMQDDGIHPTAQGCKQVAKNFLPLLLPMLHKPAHVRTRADAR